MTLIVGLDHNHYLIIKITSITYGKDLVGLFGVRISQLSG